MILFTDEAKSKVAEYMEMSEGDCSGLRVVAQRRGRHQFNYGLSLVADGEAMEEDISHDLGAFTLYVDPQSAEWLEGTTVDFVSDVQGSGFKFDNPNAVVSWDDPIAQRVQQVIDEQVAPAVGGHGGWVELLAVNGDTAVIQFGGGCQGCGMSQVTLKEGIEKMIVEAVPEISRVEDDTDHASGENPYHS